MATTTDRDTGAPRFGVDVSTPLDRDPAIDAAHAEGLGFDAVTLHGDVLQGTRTAREAWTTMTWIAARTTRVLVSPNVLVVPNRHPAVLAKMAETLQRLSGGRVVLALGAGAGMNEDAFRALGLPARPVGEAVGALAEAIDVLRGLWTMPRLTYAGRYFATSAAELRPQPDLPIPIWLGAYGPRMLELTGRRADGWLPSMFLLPPEAAFEGMRRIRAAAEAAGRDPDALTYGYNVGVAVEEGAASRRDRIAGDPAEVASQLAELVRGGFDFLNLWPAGDAQVQRERLAREVLPLVRRTTGVAPA
ncbi:MAG TPA: LLM class flavin-dependent oxidoreductase [Candidatus Dormibacteraeota bacterium]|nr:LLM class flavin-dependent oxidoreductase [Candidatus Dormibacteraeota bacterium]